MRVPIFLIFLVYTSSAFTMEHVVPENVLSSWGYKIVEVHAEWQRIKRTKAESWDDNQVYYPRFILSKTCFKSAESAKVEGMRIIEGNSKDPFGGPKSHYNSFVSGKCLYAITASARITYLSYQAEVFSKYKDYILKEAKP